MLACTITSHYGHHRLRVGYCHPKQIGHLSHGLGSTHRTHQSVKASSIGPFHEGIGHTATSWESASTAVRTREQLAHLCNAWIFIHSELFGGGKQHDSGYQTDGSKYNHCNQDEIHKCLIVLVNI
jgi:hypothetical protein